MNDAEVQPPRSRAAARTDPRRGQRAVRRAQLRRGLGRGHRQLRRRHAGARAPLLRRPQGGLHRAARAARRHARGTTPPPVGRSARARLADSVSRWLDWTEENRTIWLATIARGEDIADPDIRQVVAELVRRAVALLAASTPTSPRTRRGCATRSSAGPDSTAPPHAAGYKAKPPANRHTNCSPRRSNTSYAPSAPHPSQTGAHPLPEMRTVGSMPGSGDAASARRAKPPSLPPSLRTSGAERSGLLPCMQRRSAAFRPGHGVCGSGRNPARV